MVGPNEIILTDLVSDRVIVMTAAGVVKETYTVVLQVGDTLEVANLTGEAFDNIVIINSETGDLKAINYGTVTPLHGGEFDGLVMTDMAGSVTDHVFHLDQDGHLDWLDMDYPAYSRQLFTDSMGGVDLVWMYAHGAPDGIWPIINSSLPDDFAGSHPIINAWSCHTGNYEGHGDDGFSEAFLQAGAGVFIGSTEVSLSVENNMVNRNFYKEYWNLAGWNLAEALARRETDLLQNAPGNLFMGWWVNEYNYYGDPKFDIFTDTTLKAPAKAQTLDGKQSLLIDLPMYSLSQQDGYDFVEIPADAGLGTHAGTHYLEYDQYQVPIYIHTLEIPAGQEVQNVSLSNLANVSAAWGLQLPVSEYQIVSEASNPLARPVTASKEISAASSGIAASGPEAPYGISTPWVRAKP